MKNALYVMVGLVFTIGGVMRALWVHSHNPENINIGRALIDKNYWVYNSYEDYYVAMGWACLMAGLGFIGLLQHLLSQSFDNNKPNIYPRQDNKPDNHSVNNNEAKTAPANDQKLNDLPFNDDKSQNPPVASHEVDITPVNDDKPNTADAKEGDYVRIRPGTFADLSFSKEGNIVLAFLIIFIIGMLIISLFS